MLGGPPQRQSGDRQGGDYHEWTLVAGWLITFAVDRARESQLAPFIRPCTVLDQDARAFHACHRVTGDGEPTIPRLLSHIEFFCCVPQQVIPVLYRDSATAQDRHAGPDELADAARVSAVILPNVAPTQLKRPR